MTKSHYRLVGLLILLCGQFCAGSTTTLTGTIKDAQGSGVNGTLIMQLPMPAQDTTSNVGVAPIPVYFKLVNGAITGGAALYDVATLQPQNLYYKARGYDSAGNLVFYGNFACTGASFNLGAAVPTTITTSNVSFLAPVNLNGTNVFTGTNTFTGSTSFSLAATFTGGAVFGGETVTASPRMTWTPFITNVVSGLSVNYARFTPDKAITITRVEVRGQGTVPAGCATDLYYVHDTTNNNNSAGAVLTNGGNLADSGTFSMAVPAGDQLDFTVNAVTCSTYPTNLIVTVQYKMQ